jgi:hypothetical protein
MYLIVDKKSKAILHMSNSYPGLDRKPEDLYPAFDPTKMEFGQAPEQFIPVDFVIEKGVVKDAAPLPEAPAETIAQARERTLRWFSDMSMALRRQLIPDHQLLNAGIGIYEESQVQSYRDTVQAFRDEYSRLQIAVGNAKSVKELEAITPSFPTAIVAAKPKTPGKTK